MKLNLALFIHTSVGPASIWAVSINSFAADGSIRYACAPGKYCFETNLPNPRVGACTCLPYDGFPMLTIPLWYDITGGG